MKPLVPLSPADVAARLKARTAVLVDVREPDEHAREHVAGAVTAPLSAFEAANLGLTPGKDVIFMCRSGNRTAGNCDRLAGESMVRPMCWRAVWTPGRRLGYRSRPTPNSRWN